ncbi:DNA polymerase III subunit delta [Clostridium mediterraneense]|uniref:DNA polymerase III subunit delta n=1 Tax=Clostridium mediterraneense TaxID=1805472 RepID=UPI00083330A8|nr:DNA polymerase III subunit delta [Clostridium mediterraneense]
MIDLDRLEADLKANKLNNAYILCGLDEVLIKEAIDKIMEKSIDLNFKDLNSVKFDAVGLDYDTFMNACETLPFMAEKRAVVVSRANFLRDKCDNDSKSFYEKAKSYFETPPETTVIIAYVLLNDKRERANKFKKLLDLDKKGCTIVSIDKLKGARFYNRVEEIFKSKGKSIGKIELKYFCEIAHNNFDIIEKEVDKLVNYAQDRDITRADIDIMKQSNSEDDIFDLIDLISIKKPNKAIDLMNELFNKGEDVFPILRLIQGQFQRLYTIKVGLNNGLRVDDFVKELKLPIFIVEKLIGQSKRFNENAIKKALNISLETEKRLKSKSHLDKRTEMEIMLINILV